MQLKEEFRGYDALRLEHDAQIVQIAMEAGLRISPEQWSSLLYGDATHKSHMQSIIDKVGRFIFWCYCVVLVFAINLVKLLLGKANVCDLLLEVIDGVQYDGCPGGRPLRKSRKGTH